MCTFHALLWILGYSSCVISAVRIHVAGYEGQTVTLFCPYDGGYEHYQKYLCNSPCSYDQDVLTATGTRQTGRFRIRDNREGLNFSVSISNLEAADAGTYICGVMRMGRDIFTATATLDVQPDSCCDKATQIRAHTEDSVSIRCPYGPEHRNSLKYLCKDAKPSACLSQAVVTSDLTASGRFSLVDDRASAEFRVTFRNLTQVDSGSYLCGVRGGTGVDRFSLVRLEVEEWCCVTIRALSGTVGRPVQLLCPYHPQHKGNLKFLCKGDGRHTCHRVATSRDSAKSLELIDDVARSTFTVAIAELRAEDAGTYWCGSDSDWSNGSYVQIHLSVEANYLPIVIAASAAAGLLLILTTVIFVARKCKKSGGGRGGDVNRGKKKEIPAMELNDIYANEDMITYALRRPANRDANQESQYISVDTQYINCKDTFD